MIPRTSLALAVILVAACSSPPAPAAPSPLAAAPDPLHGLTPWSDAWILAHAPLYIEGDAAARHRALSDSLTSHENAYATTRLRSYALPRGGWDNLPEWRPRSVPLDARGLEALTRGERPQLPDDAAPFPAAPEGTSWEAWRALGERVFFELPLRAEPSLEAALADESTRASLGLTVTGDGVPGVVVFRSVEGRAELGITCALCHASVEGDRVIAGRARRTLDFGRIRLAALSTAGPVEARLRDRYLSWGPGRADVLEQISEVPIAIPDLWAMRDVRHFTQDGAITHVSPMSLAIRQETQFIQANHLATRPPRALMFALVIYLYSLAPPPHVADAVPGDAALRETGALVFARECGRCHGRAGYTGDLVPLAEIGTHPELASGTSRGTGFYRPQPLVDVVHAGPYLHHGVVPSLEALLSRERFADDYVGVIPGPVLGHAYGLDLHPDERSALLAHLETL